MNEESLFQQALEIASPAERGAFLDRECAGQPRLRAAVESLLRAHNDAGSFLDRPPLAHHSDHAARSQGLPFLEPLDKPDRIGRLGPYEIIEVIGRGGMGVVLRGFDPKLHRVVAIKVMATELAANATARKRFLREAQAAAAVSHDHVVTIHAVEDEAVVPYLVMEYIDGRSLQKKLDESGPLPLTEILRIGMQISLGLAAAHKQGLIHRDIKPANILLENGVERVKITDFGLARAVDDIGMTRTGEVAGTPQYMSPEQAQGDIVDHRTDLFSLGSVLYAMCTGRPPFRADSTVAILRRVCDHTPRPIAEVNPEIPDWLTGIIDRLLAKRPEERIQSAAQLGEMLRAHLAYVQQPTSSQPVSPMLAVAAISPPAAERAASPSPVAPPKRAASSSNVVLIVAVVLLCGACLLLLPLALLFGAFYTYRVERSAQRGPIVEQFGDAPVEKTVTEELHKAPEETDKIPRPGANGLDLIPRAAPDAAIGAWNRVDGVLVSGAAEAANQLPVPVELPDEYDVEAVVERERGDDMFLMSLEGFGVRFYVGIDAQNGKWSGLGNIDGKSYEENPTSVPGRQLTNGQRHTLRYSVRKSGVVVSIDGRSLIDFRGEFSRLSPGGYGFPDIRGLVLQTWPADSFKVHQLRLVPLPAAAPFDAKRAEHLQNVWANMYGVPVEFENTIGMKFRFIPAGEFQMGSSPEEVTRWHAAGLGLDEFHRNNVAAEAPQHRVRLSQPYYLGVHEVTVEQFRKFVEKTSYQTEAERDGTGGGLYDGGTFRQQVDLNWRNPGNDQTLNDHPVTQVSWNDAQAFCEWLSREAQRPYRLPTEAQWEFACRAGTTTPYFFGEQFDEKYGKFTGQANRVGQFAPNPFGLHDMYLNVEEWCSDYWQAGYYGWSPPHDPPGPPTSSLPVETARKHVTRGGAWGDIPEAGRSASRRGHYPTLRHFAQGFRVVLVVDLSRVRAP